MTLQFVGNPPHIYVQHKSWGFWWTVTDYGYECSFPLRFTSVEAAKRYIDAKLAEEAAEMPLETTYEEYP